MLATASRLEVEPWFERIGAEPTHAAMVRRLFDEASHGFLAALRIEPGAFHAPVAVPRRGALSSRGLGKVVPFRHVGTFPRR